MNYLGEALRPRSENGQIPPKGLQERSLAHPWIEYQKHEREGQKDTKPPMATIQRTMHGRQWIYAGCYLPSPLLTSGHHLPYVLCKVLDPKPTRVRLRILHCRERHLIAVALNAYIKVG